MGGDGSEGKAEHARNLPCEAYTETPAQSPESQQNYQYVCSYVYHAISISGTYPSALIIRSILALPVA